MNDIPAQLATLVYVQTDTHTLMLHRVKKENDMHEGKWNGLGGKMEGAETPEECAKREVLEESGIEIKDLSLAGILTFPGFDEEKTWYCFVFRAKPEDIRFFDSAEGNLEWIETSELMNLPLWEGDYHFLPWILENKFFSGKFTYSNKKLVDHSVEFYPSP